MSLSAILFLFLVHLGVGITLVLAWVGREAGVKFFRFNAGTAALLIAIGFALRPEQPRPRHPSHGGDRVARRRRGGARRLLGDHRPHARDDPAGAAVDGDRRGACRRRPPGTRRVARRAGTDAAADRRQLSQLGRAARRRVRRDGARPLVSRRAVARRRASAVDRPAAHRLDRRARRRRCRGGDDRDRRRGSRACRTSSATSSRSTASSSGSACCSALPGPRCCRT